MVHYINVRVTNVLQNDLSKKFFLTQKKRSSSDLKSSALAREGEKLNV